MRVLVVEDNLRLARTLKRALGDTGHEVTVAYDGPEALAAGQDASYEVMVLDVMLPGMDGIEVCRRLRGQRVRTPILMLTARDAVSDRVRGLDAGADDYLVKPFALEELLARVRALGRRASDGPSGGALSVGELTLDPASREVRRGEQAIELTAKEFNLLEYLMRHPGQVLTRSQIMDHVWGYDADPASNVVEIYIHYLRDKIDRGFSRPLIRTARGVGYAIRE